jgi:hypothetical protein
MRTKLIKVFHWLGSAIAILSIAFVFFRLYEYGQQIDFNRLEGKAYLIIICFALITGLANCLLAFAWWNTLSQFGANCSRLWAVRTYGISQIGKYVPGNIFHLAGRQAMGMSIGLSGWTLAKSALWELILVSVSGGLLSILALPLLIKSFPEEITTLLCAVFVSISMAVLWYFKGIFVVRAFSFYAIFLAISGGIFIGLLGLLVENSLMHDLKWAPVLGAYIFSVVIGLVTPGAPAGVGVRELVLLMLIGSKVAEADLLLAVLMGRVVSIGGDICFFIYASLINRAEKNHEVV